MDACEDACVIVATTPGVNHHAVAEHALAMLLAVARGFPGLDRCVREGRWQRPYYPRVMGSTLGIVGLGRIGQAVATRAAGLGMTLVAALQAGRLGGAGLDVFETEPLPLDSPLLACDRVLLAPHVGGLDAQAHADCFAMCDETIVALRSGGWPAACIRNCGAAETWRWDRG